MNKKLISKRIIEEQIIDDYYWFDECYQCCKCYCCCPDCYEPYDYWYWDWLESKGKERQRKIEFILDEHDCLLNTATIITH